MLRPSKMTSRPWLWLFLAACTPAEAPVATTESTAQPLPSALPPAIATATTKPAPASATVTATGLEIEELRAGSGTIARAGDTVSVHYVGTLTDGKEFDSSRKRRQPIEFKLGAHQVIQGWDEGITGMRVGQMRRLRIPPDLAYGPRGRAGAIPPNATLVFEVELMDVK